MYHFSYPTDPRLESFTFYAFNLSTFSLFRSFAGNSRRNSEYKFAKTLLVQYNSQDAKREFHREQKSLSKLFAIF